MFDAKEAQMLENSMKAFTATLLLSTCIGSGSYAQQLTTKSGVFTEPQAAAGKIAYDAGCRTCHDMRFYRDIWSSWQDKPLLDFWYFIVAEMPSDNPGSLFDAEYTDIVAYILSERGFPSGDTALDPKNGMDKINIVSP